MTDGKRKPWRLHRIALVVLIILIFGAVLVYLYSQATRPSHLSTEILVLGDSQLSFGAGPVLSSFFTSLPEQCHDDVKLPADQTLLRGNRFAMIGTRSTSLQSWTNTEGRAWELLCHKDKKWGVNASTWGMVKPAERRYVQIGEGEKFQFCRAGATPLQQLFAPGYYTPKLLMVFVGGNGAGRLARDPEAASRDVSRFVAELPPRTGCVFMMTAPIYSKSDNDVRVRAQANLRTAFAQHGDRCSFVEGHTAQTRSAIEGRAHFFKTNDQGKVIDPHHANEEAGGRFLALRHGALCKALVTQLRPRS